MNQKFATTPILKHIPPGFQRICQRTIHVASLPGMNPKGPVVAMVHGIAGSAISWLPLVKSMSRIAKKFVLMDLPGHGLSPDPIPPFNTRDAYEIVKTCLLNNLNPMDNNMVIGNSLGGAFTFRFCFECPEFVQSCVLISPAGAPFPTSARDIIEPFCAKSIGDICKVIERVFVKPTPATYLLAPVLLHTATQPGFLSLMESIIEADTNPEGPTAQLLFTPSMLTSFPCHTLFIWGNKDAVLPHEMCEFYDTYPPASVKRLFPEDMGHCPQIENPKFVARAIKDWLAE